MNTETKHVNRGKWLLNIIENVENTRPTSEESGSNVQIVNNITD